MSKQVRMVNENIAQVLDSSYIESLVCGKKSNEIRVTFKTGQKYRYIGSNREMFNAIISAENIGSAYTKILRNNPEVKAIPE